MFHSRAGCWAWASFVALCGSAILAGTPEKMSFQGRFLEVTNFATSTVDMRLELYASATGGVSRYEDRGPVDVVNGFYSTFVGDNTVSGSLQDALTNDQVWLQVSIDGTNLAPRIQFTAVPYALVAARSATADYASVAGSAGILPAGQREYKTPGTFYFVVPSNVTRVAIEAWGGNGGKAGTVKCGFAVWYGGYGGGGGYSRKYATVRPGETLSIIVGANGNNGADNDTCSPADSGTDGEPSSVSITSSGTTVVSGGGRGGTGYPSVANGAPGEPDPAADIRRTYSYAPYGLFNVGAPGDGYVLITW